MPILFKPEHVPLILSGKKTQTRRLWKKPRVKVGGVYQARTELFGKPFALIRVVRLEQRLLGDMTEEDAHAEGYPNRPEFFDAFFKINRIEHDVFSGVTLIWEIKVWVVEFEVVKEPTNIVLPEPRFSPSSLSTSLGGRKMRRYGTRVKLLVELPPGLSAVEVESRLREMGCRVEAHAVWLPVPFIDAEGVDHGVSLPKNESLRFLDERNEREEAGKCP